MIPKKVKPPGDSGGGKDVRMLSQSTSTIPASERRRKRKPNAFLFIRDGRELIVPESALTAAEREELAERSQSQEARRRFGARLRQVRRVEDAPYKRAIAVLAKKRLAGDPNPTLTDAEIESVLAGSPEHVRASYYSFLGRERLNSGEGRS
jgi:hypothetical protein